MRESIYLPADRPVDDRSNLLDYLLKITSLLGNQRWVCRNSADNPHVIGLSDLIHISRVNKKFHTFLLSPDSHQMLSRIDLFYHIHTHLQYKPKLYFLFPIDFFFLQVLKYSYISSFF